MFIGAICMSLSFRRGSTSMYLSVPAMLTTTAVVKNWQAVTKPGYGRPSKAHLFTMLRVEEQTAYKDAMSATYAALGGGGGAMASSASRSLPAASSSALLSASFPGPGLWRRRRMLVGGCVVSLTLRVAVVGGLAAWWLASSASLVKLSARVETCCCKATGCKLSSRPSLAASMQQIYLSLRCFLPNMNYFRGLLESSSLARGNPAAWLVGSTTVSRTRTQFF